MRVSSRSRAALAALVSLLSLVAPTASARGAEPAFPDAATRRWQTGAFRADRLQHASLSFALGLGVAFAGDSPEAGGGAALGAGVAKELLDRRRGRFDAGDLAADALGAAAALVAASALRR